MPIAAHVLPAQGGGRAAPEPSEPAAAGSDQNRGEAQRLADLHRLNILDTEPEQVFDDLAALASRIAGVPSATITLIDQDRQWYKAKAGFDGCSTGRDIALCDHVVRAGDELELPDARADPLFAANPLVTGPPGIVFYAGFPLFTSNGTVPGTLCVIGYEPHQLDDEQRTLLRALARQVVVQLELRVSNADQAREIELRRAAEAELAASQRMFQLLAENSTDVVCRFEADGTIAYVSPAIEAVLDIPPHEIVGGPGEPFIHPEDEAGFSEAFGVALLGGTRTITVRVRHRNGTWLWLEIIFSPTTSVQGAPEVLTSSRDVTGRVHATEELARSEQRFRSVHHDSPVGIVLSNEFGQMIEVNPAICRLLRLPEDEILGQQRDAFVVKEDPVPPGVLAYLGSQQLGDTLQMERRIRCGDGEIRWAWISVVRVSGPDGEAWTLSHIQDITDRKAAEQALEDSEANLAAIGRVVRRIQSGDDPRETIVNAAREIAQTDSAGLMERSADGENSLVVTASSNPSFAGIRFALDQPSATAQVWHTGQGLFVPDAEDSPLINRVMLAMSGSRSFLWEPIKAHGVTTAVLAVSWDHPIADLSERAARAVLLLADEAAVALEHDALMKQYEQLASTDQLTGLPNRRSWDERLAVLLALAERNSDPMVVALADVDHFKAYNDSYGHQDGDGLLREVGAAIRSELRTVDIVARWGGEEFAIALPSCSTADAMVVLERVRAAIPRGQTISIGIGAWSPGATAGSLIGKADRALYAAKRAGRNRVTVDPASL